MAPAEGLHALHKGLSFAKVDHRRGLRAPRQRGELEQALVRGAGRRRQVQDGARADTSRMGATRRVQRQEGSLEGTLGASQGYGHCKGSQCAVSRVLFRCGACGDEPVGERAFAFCQLVDALKPRAVALHAQRNGLRHIGARVPSVNGQAEALAFSGFIGAAARESVDSA